MQNLEVDFYIYMQQHESDTREDFFASIETWNHFFCMFKEHNLKGNHKRTHKATKPNIDRLCASFKPVDKCFRRLIIWCKVEEAKPYNINLGSPICKLIKNTLGMLASTCFSLYLWECVLACICINKILYIFKNILTLTSLSTIHRFLEDLCVSHTISINLQSSNITISSMKQTTKDVSVSNYMYLKSVKYMRY